MRIPKRCLGFQISLTLLIVALFPPSARGGQTNSKRTAWLVRYEFGPAPVPKGKKHTRRIVRKDAYIRVVVDEDEIVFQKLKTLFHRRNRVLLSVPDTDVTEVIYAQRPHPVSESVLADTNCSGAGLGCPLVVMGYVAAALVTLPFKTHRNYVQILWRENGTVNAIELRLDKRVCPAFLNALQDATKKPWKTWLPKKSAHSGHK